MSVADPDQMLTDATDLKQVEFLRGQAMRCRRLSRSVNDAQTVSTLEFMAAEYEDQAQALTRLT